MTFNPSIEVKSGVRAEKLDIMERAMIERVVAAVPMITPPPPLESPVEMVDAGSVDDTLNQTP